MSNIVSDYVHLFAGVLFGAVVSYVLTINNSYSVQVDINLNHKKVEDSENSVDSQSNVADFDVVYYDSDDDFEEEEDNEDDEKENNNENTNEETNSGNEGDTEEPKKDELKLD